MFWGTLLVLLLLNHQTPQLTNNYIALSLPSLPSPLFLRRDHSGYGAGEASGNQRHAANGLQSATDHDVQGRAHEQCSGHPLSAEVHAREERGVPSASVVEVQLVLHVASDWGREGRDERSLQDGGV